MVRTQIQLTELQTKMLQELAVKMKISLAELIRRSVDYYLRDFQQDNRRELIMRAKEASGKYRTSEDDLAQNHDSYLAEDYQK
jgi:hypothetical protein